MKFDLESFNENKVFKNLAIIILLVFIIYPILIFTLWGKWESGGLFGDSFGMITSLFSGAAVILLIITLIIQKKEYKITRDEFELSRKAQEQSSKALEIQAKTLKLQQFDNTFFNLMNMHNLIIHELRFGSGDARYSFSLLSNEVTSYRQHKTNPKISIETLQGYFKTFNSYFISLNNLFKFIDTHLPTEDISERKMYFDFILGRFSASEWLIFEFFVEEIDIDSLSDIIKKYEFYNPYDNRLLFNKFD